MRLLLPLDLDLKPFKYAVHYSTRTAPSALVELIKCFHCAMHTEQRFWNATSSSQSLGKSSELNTLYLQLDYSKQVTVWLTPWNQLLTHKVNAKT